MSTALKRYVEDFRAAAEQSPQDGADMFMKLVKTAKAEEVSERTTAQRVADVIRFLGDVTEEQKTAIGIARVRLHFQ
ncbi:MAG: hypothetical protein DI551_06420 [Micavibrio aeruginosavorus]|uniref:Uncharacterized protein n=1 Tax=Micavibrio aeruginosavorus TaxID=349221 RepID=A0A2W5MWW4_9BACT|nr:MAG: hypothetical protein DI551_06420 [Micavibrio aeruginosavorus]